MALTLLLILLNNFFDLLIFNSNAKDNFTIQLFINRNFGKVDTDDLRVEGRIIGVKEIKKAPEYKVLNSSTLNWKNFFLTLTFLGVILFGSTLGLGIYALFVSLNFSSFCKINIINHNKSRLKSIKCDKCMNISLCTLLK